MMLTTPKDAKQFPSMKQSKNSLNGVNTAAIEGNKIGNI